MKPLLFAVLLIVSSANPTLAQNESLQTAKTKQYNPEIKLYTFDGGNIWVKELSLFSDGNRFKGQEKVLANPFFCYPTSRGQPIVGYRSARAPG